MRTLHFILAFLLTTGSAFAQKPPVRPPPAASAHLTKTYPGAVVEGWKQTTKHFKVEFKLKGVKYNTEYSTAGVWERTEHNIEKKELPAPVAAALKASKYRSWKISDLEEHNTPQQAKAYKLKVKSEVGSAEILFAPDGKILKEKEKTKQ